MVEFHFHDSKFVLYGRSETGDEATEYAPADEDETGPADEESGGRPLAALATLAVMVGVAVAVRRRLSKDTTEEPPTLGQESTAPDA